MAILDQDQYEHIIIDGNSTDGTQDFLKSYNEHPLKWQSETDKGIYDAMNKGVEQAQGQWTIFMNAGDCFFNHFDFEVLNQFDADVVYGNSQIVYEDGFARIMRAAPLDKLWQGMSFTHQSVFVKTSILKTNPFDLEYQYCADFHQLYKLYLEGKKFHSLAEVICAIEAGGVSDTERHLATREVWEINKKLDPEFSDDAYFKSKIRKGKFVIFAKSLLPGKMKHWLVRKKYTSKK